MARQSSTTVRVVVRIRPILPHEQQQGYTTTSLEIDQQSLSCLTDEKYNSISLQKGNSQHKFTFDAVHGPQATQQNVYDSAKIKQLLSSVLEGENAAVFAYGQTGSGLFILLM